MAAALARLSPQASRMLHAAHAMDTLDMTFDAAALHRRFPDLPSTSLQARTLPSFRQE